MALASTSQCSPFDHYIVGQVLTLNGLPDYDHGLAPLLALKVRIRKLHTRTLSCTMVVNILDENSPQVKSGVAFLKLFDRRFSDQLREDSGIEPWTTGKEQAYIDSVESGAVFSFLHNLHHIENFQEDTEEDWDDAQDEAFLADKLLELYKSEIAAFDAVREHQGKRFPKLVAAVDIDFSKGSSAPSPVDENGFPPFRVKGILMEHIAGCNLFKIVDKVPRSRWQLIVDEAVSTVLLMGDHNLLNTDVSPLNFLVCTAPAGEHQTLYQVVMIDLALCRLRGPDESDAAWGRAKREEDEDGAIGLRMKLELGKVGFEVRFQRSSRYEEWAAVEECRQGSFEAKEEMEKIAE